MAIIKLKNHPLSLGKTGMSSEAPKRIYGCTKKFSIKTMQMTKIERADPTHIEVQDEFKKNKIYLSIFKIKFIY